MVMIDTQPFIASVQMKYQNRRLFAIIENDTVVSFLDIRSFYSWIESSDQKSSKAKFEFDSYQRKSVSLSVDRREELTKSAK
jgi:hypothetical protein